MSKSVENEGFLRVAGAAYESFFLSISSLTYVDAHAAKYILCANVWNQRSCYNSDNTQCFYPNVYNLSNVFLHVLTGRLRFCTVIITKVSRQLKYVHQGLHGYLFLLKYKKQVFENKIFQDSEVGAFVFREINVLHNLHNVKTPVL